MSIRYLGIKLTSFQIIILGFLGVILAGSVLLTLPVSTTIPGGASFKDALFTATSAVCVTGLVVKDTASYWSMFGQAVILLLIQIGGLGVISVSAFFALLSGRKISLLERSMLQDTISAHQIGGIVKMTAFLFKIAFSAEAVGAILMMPTFYKDFGKDGIWMAVFHSVSAFCNAGFDVMGTKTGAFSSLTFYRGNLLITMVICMLIVTGGIGFLTWEDIGKKKLNYKKYRMQTKVILAVTATLILLPAMFLYIFEYARVPFVERLCLSVFQAITPRTAGFNTADLNALSGTGRMLMILLMIVGGSPGSTAGGIKTTTAAVLTANAWAVFKRQKNAKLFGRRVEDSIVRNAATLLVMYILLVLIGASVISTVDGFPLEICLFETASAIGTVGLSLGITAGLSTISRFVLIGLMFFGRVGGLTIIFATVSSRQTDVSAYPVEKIIVG